MATRNNFISWLNIVSSREGHHLNSTVGTCMILVLIVNAVEPPLMAISLQQPLFLVMVNSPYIHYYFNLSTMAIATKTHSNCQNNLSKSVADEWRIQNPFLLKKVSKLDLHQAPLRSLFLWSFGFIDTFWFKPK